MVSNTIRLEEKHWGHRQFRGREDFNSKTVASPRHRFPADSTTEASCRAFVTELQKEENDKKAKVDYFFAVWSIELCHLPLAAMSYHVYTTSKFYGCQLSSLLLCLSRDCGIRWSVPPSISHFIYLSYSFEGHYGDSSTWFIIEHCVLMIDPLQLLANQASISIGVLMAQPVLGWAWMCNLSPFNIRVGLRLNPKPCPGWIKSLCNLKIICSNNC